MQLAVECFGNIAGCSTVSSRYAGVCYDCHVYCWAFFRDMEENARQKTIGITAYPAFAFPPEEITYIPPQIVSIAKIIASILTTFN